MKKKFEDKDIEQLLKQTVDNVSPSPLLWQKIKENLPVTNLEQERYTYRQETPGRFSAIKNLSINFIITMQKLKFVIPAVAVAIIILAVGYSQYGHNGAPAPVVTTTTGASPTQSSSDSGSQTTPSATNGQTVASASATGNVDDIASELNSEASQQASVQSQGDSQDQQDLSADSQYIDNINGASNVQ